MRANVPPPLYTFHSLSFLFISHYICGSPCFQAAEWRFQVKDGSVLLILPAPDFPASPVRQKCSQDAILAKIPQQGLAAALAAAVNYSIIHMKTDFSYSNIPL